MSKWKCWVWRAFCCRHGELTTRPHPLVPMPQAISPTKIAGVEQEQCGVHSMPPAETSSSSVRYLYLIVWPSVLSLWKRGTKDQSAKLWQTSYCFIFYEKSQQAVSSSQLWHLICLFRPHTSPWVMSWANASVFLDSQEHQNFDTFIHNEYKFTSI